MVLQGGRDVQGTVASLGASAAALACRAEGPAEAREAPVGASAWAPVAHLDVPCDLAEAHRTAAAVVAYHVAVALAAAAAAEAHSSSAAVVGAVEVPVDLESVALDTDYEETGEERDFGTEVPSDWEPEGEALGSPAAKGCSPL